MLRSGWHGSRARPSARRPERIELEGDRLNQFDQRLLTISAPLTGVTGIGKARLSLREPVEHVVRDAEYEKPGRGLPVFSREPTE